MKLNTQPFTQKQHDRKVLDALCEIKESRADVERIMNVIAGLLTEPSNNRTATTFPKNKWFDRECKVQKRRVNDVKKKFIALANNPLSQRQLLPGKEKV